MIKLIRQHPVITAVVVVVVVLLAWGFRPQPVLVETVAAERSLMAVAIEEEGRTRVIDRYVISAPVNGVTCRQQLNVGDAVERNEVLLVISPLESPILDQRARARARAGVAAAEAALQSAREQAQAATAAAQLAENEVERLRPLLERQLISPDVFDRAQTEAQTQAAARRSATFNAETAKYELEAARTALELTTDDEGDSARQQVEVRSPINGRILKIAQKCEGPVMTGEPLLEVGDPTALEVEVDVLSADAVKIEPGTDVLFERWGGSEPLAGVVRTVEPVGFTKVSALGVEEQRVWIISDFTSPSAQWQRLGDGYRVEARFILWQEDDVLQVPASSLFRYRDGWALFVAEGGRAERRTVEVGQRNGVTAQILAGVEAGEAVLNHPSDDVEDGIRIRAVDEL